MKNLNALQQYKTIVAPIWSEFETCLAEYVAGEFYGSETQKAQLYGRLNGLEFALLAAGVNPDAIKAAIKNQHAIKNAK